MSRRFLKPLLKGYFLFLTPCTDIAGAAVILEGNRDFRPSWTASAGTLHTENEVSAGLRVEEN